MKRQSMTVQRSPWIEDVTAGGFLRAANMVEPDARVYRRSVHDGTLTAVVGTIPAEGCHLSVSHHKHNGDVGRYPTWDEIAHARYELCPGDIEMVMFLPPMDAYVAIHPSTFHLHEHRGAS